MTAPLTLAEASTDRLWGTGVGIWDSNALNSDCWINKGWISRILGTIRDEEIESDGS